MKRNIDSEVLYSMQAVENNGGGIPEVRSICIKLTRGEFERAKQIFLENRPKFKYYDYITKYLINLFGIKK